MGCVISRADASDVLRQCKERRKAIKDAVSRRQDFALAHVEYMQALRNVSLALRRFSEGEVSDMSPESPSTPILRLPEASHSSTPVAPSSPPGHLADSLSPSSSSPCSSHVSHSPPVIITPAPALVSVSVPMPVLEPEPTPTKAASPASPPLPVSVSPPASSHASHFSQSSPPPLTQASSPPGEMEDASQPYSGNGMGSPDRISDFSPPFYSPGRDDTDDYFNSPPQHFRSPPPMPSPSHNLWFMYDIFDAPPIPYNLLEQRRRKQGVELEDEEDAPAPDLQKHAPAPDSQENAHKDDGIPELEEEDRKEEEEVLSVKSVGKGKEVEENESEVNEEEKGEEVEETASATNEEKEVEVVEKPEDVLPEMTVEIPVEKTKGEVEKIVIPPSPEKVVVIRVEPKVSPKKELAIQTSGQGRDLVGAVKHIHVHFRRACKSGKDVSGMLETQMVNYHLGFSNTKDSSKVFNAITWHWSQKSSLAMREAYAGNDTPECSMMFGSHALTLERLYAWEKKLYDEVKAGEAIRIQFKRKCHRLQNLDAKGGDPQMIDKTRVALKKLETRHVVALRAMYLASVKIQKLANDELFPQLAELLQGLMSMWKVMWECHRAQAAIAAEMQSIENSAAGNEATEAHIKATSQLEQELERWQSHFQQWISSQRNYIEALHAWLSKCHLEPERESRGRAASPPWRGKPKIFYLLSNWKDALLKLEQPQQAVDAICNFSVVVHSLEIEQAGELDLKKNAEKSAWELDYKSRSLQKPEHKYIEYKEDPNSDISRHMADLDDRRSVVESQKRRHMEVMLDRKQKTLSRFREHLPAVFESMASFAKEALKTYENLLLDKMTAQANGVAHYVSED